MSDLFQIKIIDKAYIFASTKHGSQQDDSGENYFESHVKVVAKLVGVVTDDEEIIASALLHDVIEDTNATYDEVLKEFGKRIANLVMEVTQEGKKDNYGYYFPRLKTKDGILIKFMDRASNISRMDCWNRQRQTQYLKKSKFWKSEGKQKGVKK